MDVKCPGLRSIEETLFALCVIFHL